MARIKIEADKKREVVIERIKAVARQQMQMEGAAALSLRAIARELDITAPALYRYYADRDALITDLILDAFNALADYVEERDHALPPEQYADRLYTALINYRQWSLDHAVDFELIYGSPIPGYTAPAELTVPAAARMFHIIVGILDGAYRAGILKPTAHLEHIPPSVAAHLAQMSAADGYNVPPILLAVASLGWAHIHGIIMLEVHHHLPPVVGDVDAFYRHDVLGLLESMNMHPTIP